VAFQERTHRGGPQTLAHLLELPQFIRHACLVLAVAVDLGQPSHHRSIRSDFDVPVATTTHPAVWFPENVTAEPFSQNRPQAHTWRAFAYWPDVFTAVEERDWLREIEALPFKPFEFHGYLGKRSGPARHEWEHSIPPVESKRYSVIFRTFVEDRRLA
jgi:hypothetical protein